MSAAFFQEASDRYHHPYWLARAEAAWAAGGDRSSQVDGDPDRLLPPTVPEAEVRAAFDAIRERDRLGAKRGSTLRMFERPNVDGHRIVLRDHLASDTYPGGMRFVRDVDLLRMVETAQEYDDVPAGWSAYNGIASPVTLPDYLTALATAFAAGFLEHRAE